MGKTISITIISGDASMDTMMHCADVFESSKMLAWPQELTATLSGQSVEIDKVLLACVQACRQSKKCVAAVFSIDFPNDIWKNENVISISNGHHWALLGNVLDRYGMSNATDVRLLKQ